jgi:hypothetical protein
MQTFVSVLIFIGIGLAMYFLFRRGIGGCCGGHEEGKCGCRTASSAKYASGEQGEDEYFEEIAGTDEKT